MSGLRCAGHDVDKEWHQRQGEREGWSISQRWPQHLPRPVSGSVACELSQLQALAARRGCSAEPHQQLPASQRAALQCQRQLPPVSVPPAGRPPHVRLKPPHRWLLQPAALLVAPTVVLRSWRCSLQAAPVPAGPQQQHASRHSSVAWLHPSAACSSNDTQPPAMPNPVQPQPAAPRKRQPAAEAGNAPVPGGRHGRGRG